MIPILMFLVAILYTGIGIGYFIAGNLGLGIAFICYAMANLGIWWSGR